jgi:hypothetical protein
MILNTILEKILGMADYKNVKKTKVRIPKSIFGLIYGYYSVIETQGRGSLHCHMIIWGGLSPSMIQNGCLDDKCKQTFIDILNQSFQCYLPGNIHLETLIQQQMRKNKIDVSNTRPIYDKPKTINEPGYDKKIYETISK